MLSPNKHYDVIAEDRILLLPAVCEITNKSRSSIYRDMADKSFPGAIKIGKSRIGWRATEVNAWLRARPQASYRQRLHQKPNQSRAR